MDELDPEDAKRLAMLRQARKNEREATQEVVDSHLAASSVMVTQVAAMDIAKLSTNPFFSK